MRRLLVLLGAALLATIALAAVAVAGRGPERIPLPDGFRPEGIAAGAGGSVYVGSIPTGRVLELDTRTGASREAVPARPQHAAIGLDHDRRAQRLFVAGGPTGRAFVYDAHDGAELAALTLTGPGQETFVNDVALTRQVAYFTDSRQPVVYAVRRDLSGVRPLRLRGFPITAGTNLNGLEAARGGRVLLAVQTSTGALWRIDPATRSYVAVDLGGAELTGGDGLLLRGRTLLVVQNRLNRIAVVKLDRRLRSGRVVRTIAHPDFDVPTTVALTRGQLFLPNARFTTPPTPETDYWVTRVGER